MPHCYELQLGRTSSEDETQERAFVVLDCPDRAQAQAVALAKASVAFEGLLRSPIPAMRPLGYDAWEASFKYSPVSNDPSNKEPQGTEPTDAVLEFDTGGATQHITVALAQTHYPTNAPDMKRAIGVSQDAVEGADIVVPEFKFSLSHKWTAAGIAAIGGGDYLADLFRLTGKTNSAPWTAVGTFQGVVLSLSFEAQEVLFLGAQGGGDGRFFPIKYSFVGSPNRTGLSISTSITGISKKGHEYLWVSFEGEASQNALVQKPKAAYVAQVYESDNFGAKLRF